MYRIYAIIALVILSTGLGLFAWVKQLQTDSAKRDLGIAVTVNKDNQEKFTELQRNLAAERALTEKELAEAQKRASATNQLKKELENAPDAQKPVGPYFDELSRRLQSTHSEE